MSTSIEFPIPFMIDSSASFRCTNTAGRRCLVTVTLALAGLILSTQMSSPVQANSTSFQQEATDQPAVVDLSVGFRGKVVLGRWVPVRVTLAADIQANRVSIQTLDGDAVPVSYPLELAGTVDGGQLATGMIRVGRAAGVTVSIENEPGESIERRISLDELSKTHSFLPGTTRLSLFLGLKSKEQMDLLETEGRLSDENVWIDDLSLLPTDPVALDSVRTIVLVPATALPAGPAGSMLETLSAGIESWVNRGGHLIVTGGSLYQAWFRSAFREISPGSFVATETVKNSGSVELFIGATQPLTRGDGPDFRVTVIELPEDRKTSGSVGDFPLISRWAKGFGQMTYTCVDFTSRPLSQWEGRSRLCARVWSDQEKVSDNLSSSRGGRVSHFGYTDISGQLRGALDQFTRVPIVTFTIVALIVGLFILAIGPGDFFFLKKFAGRMELTWLTFSLICLAFSGLAWYLATTMKSANVELNQVEFVDIDAESGQSRGMIWTHIYSPGTDLYDLALEGDNQLVGNVQNGWLSWQGLPGTGMGAMQSRSDLGLYRQRYENVSPGHSDEAAGLSQVPLQQASTKTLIGGWYAAQTPNINSRLRRSPTSDALLGSFTNPFDVPIYDVVILYGDWAYAVENRALNPGETVLVEDDLREKTITGQFTRRVGQGEEQVEAAWNPQGTDLLEILQTMSIFQAIGGQSYVKGLTNDFHPSTDLTSQLKLGKAVLLGQIPSVVTPLKVNGQAFDKYDQRMTMVRILLPVQDRK